MKNNFLSGGGVEVASSLQANSDKILRQAVYDKIFGTACPGSKSSFVTDSIHFSTFACQEIEKVKLLNCPFVAFSKIYIYKCYLLEHSLAHVCMYVFYLRTRQINFLASYLLGPHQLQWQLHLFAVHYLNFPVHNFFLNLSIYLSLYARLKMLICK